MEQCRNERAVETEDPRVNPPTNGIVRHDSYVLESRVTQQGIEPGSPWWEASRLTAQPPWPPVITEQRWNAGLGKMGDPPPPRENALTNVIVRHDSLMPKSGKPREKPADQRHRTARFPLAKIREWAGRRLNPFLRDARQAVRENQQSLWHRLARFSHAKLSE
ncbi:hypothetical protein PR048_013806 [Dryococelus australis]|uniref:Uncharacterized protein n=1 Tax=Dryococelus australis TaxID=614101 RepID=A0ABQ9HU20_9NEOP|nr:hypothetical protein PR048_013806 [Dryococelus australis]